MATLTFPSISVAFNGDQTARTDLAVVVKDASGSTVSATLTVGAKTYDATVNTTTMRTVLSGVAIPFSAGDATYSFTGDATIRPFLIDLAPYLSAVLQYSIAPASGLPQGSELAALFATSGVPMPPTADPNAALNAAAEIFQETTGRIPIVYSGTPGTRVYSPPVTRSRLLWTDDFLALTSVSYQPTNSTAQVLTVGTDYRLLPVNAAAKGKPYTGIEFLTYSWWQPLSPYVRDSLTLTGQWGYCATLPADIRRAILMMAALELLGAGADYLHGGVSSWAQTAAGRTMSESYSKQFQSTVEAWQGIVMSAIASKKKVTGL